MVKAGKEPGELGELRTKLLFLLQTSTQYQSMKLQRYFPTDCELFLLHFYDNSIASLWFTHFYESLSYKKSFVNQSLEAIISRLLSELMTEGVDKLEQNDYTPYQL